MVAVIALIEGEGDSTASGVENKVKEVKEVLV